LKLALWEDKTIWVSVALLPTENNSKYEIGFYPGFESLGFETIIDAFINTVSISTRLCYSESPLPLLRRIWKYKGEVKVTGKLKNAQSHYRMIQNNSYFPYSPALHLDVAAQEFIFGT
jgi:hypothetical protein